LVHRSFSTPELLNRLAKNPALFVLPLVHQYTQPVCLNNYPLYVVDGIKVGKAGKKMPGVKLLHQESEDNTKPEYIMGHFWGALSLLVKAPGHVFSIPVRFQIQDGIKRSPSQVTTLIDKMGALITDTIDKTVGIVVFSWRCSRTSRA
jgi:hypothetical protein